MYWVKELHDLIEEMDEEELWYEPAAPEERERKLERVRYLLRLARRRDDLERLFGGTPTWRVMDDRVVVDRPVREALYAGKGEIAVRGDGWAEVVEVGRDVECRAECRDGWGFVRLDPVESES